jgi:hypothetical protein
VARPPGYEQWGALAYARMAAVEWLSWKAGRARCRLLRVHGPGCRGRTDHISPSGLIIDPGRWQG